MPHNTRRGNNVLIDLAHLFSPDPRIDQVLSSLHTLNLNTEKVMATLADITLAIQAQSTIEQGVVALLHQLSTQLQAAVDAEDPAAVQSVLDLLTANTKTLSDAVLANTPSAVGSATLATPVPTPISATPPADATPQPPPIAEQTPLAPGDTVHPVTGEVIPPAA
jgi:hypothetical protein